MNDCPVVMDHLSVKQRRRDYDVLCPLLLRRMKLPIGGAIDLLLLFRKEPFCALQKHTKPADSKEKIYKYEDVEYISLFCIYAV